MAKSNANTAVAATEAKSTYLETPKAQRMAKIKRELADIGKETGAKSVAELEAAKAKKHPTQAATPGLARGLKSTDAPHSQKAVKDAKSAASPAKATTKTDKAQATKAAKVTARAERAAPKAGDTRKITIVDKKFTFGREGSARHDSWTACTTSKTVTEYLAKGGKAKYLPRWVAAKVITLA